MTKITINKAQVKDVNVLALLGTVTYTESHGHFIDNKKDLMRYNESAFSVSQIENEMIDPKNIFFIISKDDLPIGYAKLVLNSTNKNVDSQNSCQLERIYILNEFIPLKIGQRFLTFLEEKAKELKLDTIWLSVYGKNIRAIRFYERNNYKEVGKSTFLVNDKEYENKVFLKEV
ncbi:GNAT family N-acetyltransferase [Hanstruepera marina]|uniref:GNAT family N-acetyltransferase n=1 Tax=Hanstruepera marina TaxID=2873265 RepID=UPI001CA77C50|nr:GNAT family N-acetyltransferase [Hanstruepera marina]